MTGTVVVLGVLDETFSPPEALVGRATDVWRPLDLPAINARGRGFHVLRGVGPSL
jgi:hypothetical protein